MSTWLDVDDQVIDLADAIAHRLGSTKQRVIKLAVALLAVDVGVKFDLPRKENEDA